MTAHNGGPAFPAPARFDEETREWDAEPHFIGMSLRDYFAAKAMQAVLSVKLPEDELLSSAQYAYAAADAMLAAREAQQ